MKIFIRLNLRTKKFTGKDFFTGRLIFENVKEIPAKKSDCIIYQGNGNNIHPSLWKDEWFKKEV